MTWMGAGHLATYRRAWKITEGRMTPDVMAGLSVAQKLLVFQPDSPADAMAQAFDLANAARAKRGLPPLKGRDEH